MGLCCLKLQAAFTGSIGKRFNATMVLVVTSVQFNSLDASSRRLLSDRFSDRSRRIAIATIADIAADRLIPRAGTDQSLA